MKTILRLCVSAAIAVCLLLAAAFAVQPTVPTWERVELFGGYSLLRYEYGATAEEKSYNSEDVLVGHRYTDGNHKTHVVTYDPLTGEETGNTVIE